MARSRKTYNNWLIFLVIAAGALLYSTGQVTGPTGNSIPLLPDTVEVDALVYAELAISIGEDAPHSNPPVDDTRLRNLIAAWRDARLVPVADPDPKPTELVQVDVYLADGSAPQTALLYPQQSLVKMLGQPQWWRLVNQDMHLLLPPEPATPSR
ncbi:hypothetical protein KUV89_15095 [Marinobacter hydrocarbonoclasticus]|nr:hypothetical protein [Marinobacter nauticus]